VPAPSSSSPKMTIRSLKSSYTLFMYYYILDPQNLDPAKFERQQVELQGLLAEFKISGEMSRVSSLRTVQDLVETASERGAKTLIACGTDDTFNLMLSYLRGRDFTVGFIPLDQDQSYLSKILGIDTLLTAAKTIAARRIEKIDLATLGPSYFISYVEFGIGSSRLKNLNWWNSMKALSVPEHKFKIRIDNSYDMEITCLGGIIANSRPIAGTTSTIANPTDGFLDLLILERLNKVNILRYKQQVIEGHFEQIPHSSVIKCRKVEFLEPRGFPLTMEGRIFAKVPTAIELIPRRLRMIVGKNRTF
jgi:diacylglycerol kinase family enzyme